MRHYHNVFHQLRLKCLSHSFELGYLKTIGNVAADSFGIARPSSNTGDVVKSLVSSIIYSFFNPIYIIY
jgi:hypothetical protein